MGRFGFVLVATLALCGCASIQQGAVRQGGIVIDHMLMPAADTAGTDVAAYAGFDNLGGEDRLLAVECSCAHRSSCIAWCAMATRSRPGRY